MPTKKKTTKKVVKKAKPKKTGYSLKVTVNGLDFKTKGETVREALEKFIDHKDFPYGSKTNAVFIVEKGKDKGTFVTTPIRTRRLFLQFPQKGTAVEVFSATLERRIANNIVSI